MLSTLVSYFSVFCFVFVKSTRRYSVLQDGEKTLKGNDRGILIIYDTSISPKEVLLRV